MERGFREGREDPAWYYHGHLGICKDPALNQLLYGSVSVGATGVCGNVDL